MMKGKTNKTWDRWPTITLSSRTETALKYAGAILLVIGVEQGMIVSFTHTFHPVLATIFYAIDVPFFFIMANNIIPYVLHGPNRLLKLLLSVTLSFACFILLQNIVSSLAIWQSSGSYSFSLENGWKKPLWRGIQMLLYASAYYLAKEGIKKAKEARSLEVKNLQLETAYLRSKIKPHFIFNTLQFIYGQVAEISPQAAESISLFADVIEYAQDSDQADGTIASEIAQVNNYIALNRARLGDQLCLDLNIRVDDSCGKLRLPPLLIINIIENMFVHGQLYHPASPAKVSIRCMNGKLEVYAWNLKARALKFKTGGFGLNYVLRQLEKTYPNRHTYTINEGENFYELRLIVDL